ncbi:DUF3565 domain-containing protein [Pseudomonas dryadis]|uniref:DUF3565 domain-containing protein n=1 Tax=Phytopseudomonas dryadis TaxID=2487520 RepID=A0A4Q9QXQ1_9GAMM|nr:DUF3565 domain-containing protein [Pseudomonas dryadis]TBV05998.1 DUF3565 domain-containing protein [Pseudomonas dryadis]TBV18139.1 DUF3565 domain-containing protein [Pseudomonas sp. FRB 230]
MGSPRRFITAAARRLTMPAQQTLVDFRQDEDGHWVAVLSCGHTQHLRHQPPWQNRAWVLDETQRRAHIGQNFRCGWCVAAVAHGTPTASNNNKDT